MVPFFVVPWLYDHFSDLLSGSYFASVAGLIMLALMMWGLVELYFLRGTK